MESYDVMLGAERCFSFRTRAFKDTTMIPLHAETWSIYCRGSRVPLL